MTNSLTLAARRTTPAISHSAPRSTRICRIESLEKRELLAVDGLIITSSSPPEFLHDSLC